ncbi:MAG: hypothetical protein MUF81_08475, partial [Verrucomicrobia bacterium]|nr:hypothetical protein [Verrucomicrobiota bacterium]
PICQNPTPLSNLSGFANYNTPFLSGFENYTAAMEFIVDDARVVVTMRIRILKLKRNRKLWQ